MPVSLSTNQQCDVLFFALTSFRESPQKSNKEREPIQKRLAPVFASQLTLIVVFLPLVIADFEQWLKPILHTIAFTVTSTILASTIAAFLFVPIFSERFLQHDKQLQPRSEKGKNRICFSLSAITVVNPSSSSSHITGGSCGVCSSLESLPID